MSSINDFLIKSAAESDMGYVSPSPAYSGNILYPPEAENLDFWERLSLLNGGDRDNMHAASIGGTLGTSASLLGAGALAARHARKAIDRYGQKLEADAAKLGKRTSTPVKVFGKNSLLKRYLPIVRH